MQRIKPFLWFDDNAEEAANLYVSIFPNSKIVNIHRQGDESSPAVFVDFELEGLEFMALNGGPHHHFTPAISLFVSCETQAEVDELWARLSEGGKEVQCGWLEDRFGLSWQIIPTALGRLLGDPDREKAGRVMQAMLGMVKIEIDGLTRAYEGQ